MKLKIYFDGLCPLCSREIDHYKKRDQKNEIIFIDISNKDFNAANEGFEQKELEKFFHVRAADGTVYRGLDAFVQIWQVLPGFSWLAAIAKNPLARPLLIFSYKIFAMIRPYLPKRKPDHSCNSDRCSSFHKQP